MKTPAVICALALLTTTANTTEDLAVIAPRVPAEVRLRAEAADPTLDKDLAAWAARSCDRPRLSVLGPMRLRVGPGPATPPTNAFIQANAAGTDFARSDDRFRYQSIRATVAYRF